ncbi:hypothetical protein DFH06DRAFT_949075, partial [Mycena polygramma]
IPTFKVIIDSSCIDKTSLCGQCISSLFLSSYRAPIGADFITNTLVPLTAGGEPVVLQIRDKAGQERFSSLASTFFRGDDVTALEMLHALRRWLAEFHEKVPVADDNVRRLCIGGEKAD